MIFTSFESYAISDRIDSELKKPEAFRKIMVPVDFSPCAENAIRFAVAIALRTGAAVNFQHCVYIPLSPGDAVVDLIDRLKAEALENLAKIETEVKDWLDKSEHPPVDISYEAHVGFASDEIVRAAEENDVDLVVMGTKGAGALEGKLIGSTATNVLTRLEKPVLVVPEEAHYHGVKKIVYSTDMEKIDHEAMVQLVDFARIFDAEIDVVHIVTPREHISLSETTAFGEEIADELDYDRISFHLFEADDNDVVDAIEDYMEDEHADIVAMLTENKGFLKRIFHPSMTKKLALKTEFPLLALHYHRE